MVNQRQSEVDLAQYVDRDRAVRRGAREIVPGSVGRYRCHVPFRNHVDTLEVEPAPVAVRVFGFRGIRQ